MKHITKRSYDIGYGFRVNTEINEEKGKVYFLVTVSKDGSIQFFDETIIKKEGE